MVLDFRVNVSEESNVSIVRVNGEIDIYTCPKLSKTLQDVQESKKNSVVLNLEKVQYIDSTGLGAIAHSAQNFFKSGGKLNIVCTKPQVKKVFDVSGLSKKNILLFDEEKSAIENITQGKEK